MSGVEIKQRAASEGQRGGRRGQEWRPTPLHKTSWSTVPSYLCKNKNSMEDSVTPAGAHQYYKQDKH